MGDVLAQSMRGGDGCMNPHTLFLILSATLVAGIVLGQIH